MALKFGHRENMTNTDYELQRWNFCKKWKNILLKSSGFWDITSCSPLKANRCFGGTCCLHLQGQRISQRINQNEAGSKQSSAYRLFHAGFFALLATCFTLVSYLAYTSTLRMEVTCSSKTLVDFEGITWSYSPEDRTLNNHRCENLKSYRHALIYQKVN
jgi:hypothetical protein